MKKSLLFLAVASMFALASCGGEKAPEVTEAPVEVMDTVAAVVEDTASPAPVDTTVAQPAETEAAH